MAQETTGTLRGTVVLGNGDALGGVTVTVEGTGVRGETATNGEFSLRDVPAGPQTLRLTLGTHAMDRDVEVVAGESTTIEITVDWDIHFMEMLTVYSASRKAERAVDAPAAVTVVTEDQIERQASTGQIPKLIEFTPGAEVTQSGLYDYNVNTRGFNSSLNRRVATLIDGRNPSVPFLGAQEWAAISFPMDDLASVEMVRGPSAALYGANASSGVLNMTTKQPRYSEGGTLRLTAGELSTTNADFRWAGKLRGNWYLKAVGGLRNSGDFTTSRNGAAEYTVPCSSTVTSNCLPQEPVPLTIEDDNEISFGGVRLDGHFDNGGVLTLEGGTASIEGPVFQTGIGRVQLVDVERPWARINYTTDHWNVLAYRLQRDAPRQTALASGANLHLDTERLHLEVQTNWGFREDRVGIVAGGTYTEEDIETRGTLTFAPIEADMQALYGQVDWQVHDRVGLLVAARFDDSTLHDSQFSPKASAVFSFNSNHNVRLTYNEAFQVANYSEFFLRAPVAPPADLSALEGLCLLSGVTNCGLADPVPVLAVGNDDLEVEEIRTVEVGYTGIFGGKTFVTLDVYSSENSNFITDLLPNLGTPLGRVNPDFGPWEGSDEAESTACALNPTISVADCVRGSAPPILSNDQGGAAVLAAVSYTNFGDVDTEGVDLALNHYIGNDWRLSLAYSWFDYEVKESAPGLDSLLLPNTPENKAVGGVSYVGSRLDASLSARWVDDFRWVVGPFQGDVEAYTTVDLVANWAVNDAWSLGINVANVFDDEHWEAFGGDLLGRRALGSVTFHW